jgi:antitoxin ChpS
MEIVLDAVIRKYGNSSVVVLPPALMRDLGIQVGTSLSMKAADGVITLAPKKRYTLEELVAQCNPKAKPPADMAAWDDMPSVGRERI